MKALRLISALGTLLIGQACAPQPIEVSFFYDWSRVEESRVETLATTRAIVTSQKFWSAHVAPKLNLNISAETQERVRNSIQLQFGKGSRGKMREVKLSLRYGEEPALREAAAAIIAGLDVYLGLISSPDATSVVERR